MTDHGGIEEVKSNMNALSDNSNINEFLGKFVQGDAYDPYMAYVFANLAKEWFQQQIERLDKKNDVIRLSEGFGVPPAVVEKAKALYAEVFRVKIVELESMKKKWAESNSSFYRQQPCLPSSKEYGDAFRSHMGLVELESEITLDQAVQGYKAASEVLKGISNESLDPYCTEVRPMLNNEHREEYNGAVMKFHGELGLPLQDEWIASLPLLEEKFPKKRLSLDRKPAETYEHLGALHGVFCQAVLKVDA